VKSKPSICYLTFDSLFEGVGRSQIVPLIKGIGKKGYPVSVITFEKDNSELRSLDFENANINWISLPFGRAGLWGLPERIFRMVRAVPKADIYHCRSDLPVLALLFKKNSIFLWDVRSLWFEQKALIDGRKQSGLIFRLALRLEKSAASKASAINVLASPLLGVLKERNGKIPNIQSVIPTSVDLELFNQSLNLPKKKTAMISGTVNNFYDINLTVKILDWLNEDGFEIIWCKPSESSRKDIQRSYVTTRVKKHEEMPVEITNASFGIAICRDDAGDVLKGVMPTKISEFLAVGRPVIISAGMGDLDHLVISSNTGIVVSQSSSREEFLRKAMELLDDPDLSNRCRTLAESHFSMGKAIKSYEEIYMKLHELQKSN
jgi:glycosyltransferase involved in cell wall biosynthesis